MAIFGAPQCVLSLVFEKCKRIEIGHHFLIVEDRQMHMIDTDYQHNDRVAAVHWGEGVHGGFVVWGYHYLQGYMRGMYFDSTFAEGCNIIEGWD